MSDHVPAPYRWHVNASGHVATDECGGENVAIVSPGSLRLIRQVFGDDWRDEKGNPRSLRPCRAPLIAAAPELLEAARGVEEILARYIYPVPDRPDAAWAKLQALRAAIAKAEGRHP